jgi:hypothetical protein
VGWSEEAVWKIFEEARLMGMRQEHAMQQLQANTQELLKLEPSETLERLGRDFAINFGAQSSSSSEPKTSS